MCETAPLGQASSQDIKLLQAAGKKTDRENHPKKETRKNRPRVRKKLVLKSKCLFSVVLHFQPSTCQKRENML